MCKRALKQCDTFVFWDMIRVFPPKLLYRIVGCFYVSAVSYNFLLLMKVKCFFFLLVNLYFAAKILSEPASLIFCFF